MSRRARRATSSGTTYSRQSSGLRHARAVWLALLGLLAGAAGAGAATLDAATREAALEFTMFDPLAQEGSGGVVLFALQADGKLWLRESDFAALQLRRPDVEPRLVEGERYFALDALAGLRWELDEASQRVVVHAPATAFVGTRSAVHTDAPPPADRAAIGASLNYQIFGQRSDERTASGLAELGLFSGWGVLTSTTIARHDATTNRAIRLDTTFTRDFPDRLTTLSLGDAISDGGSYGDSVRFGGLRLARNFELRPDLVTTPLLTASGTATVPSTVDVFINGELRARERVAPGPFILERVPAISGSGDLRVVVRDALGRETITRQPFYSSANLLARGLTQYAVNAGQLREDYASSSSRYGAALAQGTWRRGITDAFTLEAHGEYLQPGVRAVGATLTAGLGRIGTVSGSTARGGDAAGSGWLRSISFERRGPRISMFASDERRDADYRQVGDAPFAAQRLRARRLAQLGLVLGRAGSLSLAWAQQQYAAQARVDVVSVTHSLTVGELGALTSTFSHTRSERNSSAAFITFTRSLDARRTLSVSAAADGGADDPAGNGNADALRSAQAVASLMSTGPPGPGVDYRLSAATDGDYDGRLRRRSDAFEVELQASRSGDNALQSVQLSGAATLLGGTLHASRSVTGSFALVDVGGVADLPIYLENQLVARTDASGRALLPDLRPYEANRIGIDPTDVPLDVSIDATELIVAPPWRSGVVAKLAVLRVRGGTFRLRQETGAPVPVGAIVTFNGQQFAVALDGLVYVTNFDHGLAATADWDGGRCRFRIEPPPAHDPQPDMGVLVCRNLGAPDLRVQNRDAANSERSR